MFAWGAVNSAIPVCWATWLSKGISDEPESGGGLMVGAIQLSIMLGAAFGGLLLDHISVAATLIGGTILLVLASLTIGRGKRIQARVLKPDTNGRSELAGVSRFRGLPGRAG
jgi:predicted MFS family arabinose efflux permease